ncbi:MAG: hypothetical protein L6428_08980 [Candidatus Aminicenantes bacterium]|nr:hypothetical protein [Candidatus Aminicenantes bacterium]
MSGLKFFLTCLAAIFLLKAGFAAAKNPEQVLKEKIAVLNVEVPVRVFLDGLPLSGLQKDDFRLFEDNEPQTINGFYQRRKKMNVQQIRLLAEQESSLPPPRYFVLCFRIIDFNDPLRKGMDYFFQHILREQDQLLVLVNERTLLLNQDVWQVKRQEILEQVLRDEAGKARMELEAYFLRVRQDIDQTRLHYLVENNRQNFTIPQIINFLQRYFNVWQEFKKKYLIPDLDKFYNFAHHLEKIKAEKWVLNFYQIEMFPKMKISGPIRRQINALVDDMTASGGSVEQFAKVISRSLDAIDRAMNVAGEFPAEQIGKMLIRVDTTYHCFISGVVREGLSEDLEYKKVASDLENSLREITKSSGGEVIFSGNIGSALHAIEEKEDVYYVLTYEPKNRERTGKVRIELNDPRCRLFYDDQVRSDYIAAYLKKKKVEDPTLQLDRISLDGCQLQLEISSFKMLEAKANKSGQLRVAISIRDDHGRTLYEQNRSLAAKEANVSLAVDFTFLKPGKYFFLVDVCDLLSGRTVTDVLLAEVKQAID